MLTSSIDQVALAGLVDRGSGYWRQMRLQGSGFRRSLEGEQRRLQKKHEKLEAPISFGGV
jgi:hypothetical protein